MAHEELTPLYLCFSTLDTKLARQISFPFDPESTVFPLRKWAAFQHWALLVHGYCFELTSIDSLPGSRKVFKVKVSRFRDWEASRTRLGRKLEKVKVGATVWTLDAIEAEANDIYARRFEKGYSVTLSNCQNFVKVLLRSIELSRKDARVSIQERRSWRSVPWNNSLFITLGQRSFGVASAALTFMLYNGHTAGEILADPSKVALVLLTGLGPYWWHKSRDAYYLRRRKLGIPSDGFLLNDRPQRLAVRRKPAHGFTCSNGLVDFPYYDSYEKRYYCPSLNCSFQWGEWAGWARSGDCIWHVMQAHGTTGNPCEVREVRNLLPYSASDLVPYSPDVAASRPSGNASVVHESGRRVPKYSPRYALITRTTKHNTRYFLCSDSRCPFSSGNFLGWTNIAECENHIRRHHLEEPGTDPRYTIARISDWERSVRNNHLHTIQKRTPLKRRITSGILDIIDGIGDEIARNRPRNLLES